MSCKFSCFLSLTNAQKETDIGIFYSDSGDVYKVKYKSNICKDLLLIIEWTVPKQILLTVKLYTTSFKRCFVSKGMIINGKKAFMKLRGAFNFSNSRDYKVLCVVNLIPYIKFNDNNKLSTALSIDSGFDSEFQKSSLGESNVVTYEEINSRYEVVDKNTEDKNSSITNVNEMHLPKQNETSLTVNEVAPALPGNIDLKNKFVSEESIVKNSENIMLLIKKGRLNSFDLADEAVNNDNVCKTSLFQHNSEHNKNCLETFIGNDFNANCPDNEFKVTNNVNTDTNLGKNIHEPKIIAKPLILNDYGEEVIENIKTINVDDNIESNDKLSENNSFMDVDLFKPFFENPTSSCNENISFSSSDGKVRREFFNNVTQEISQTTETELHAVSENEETQCSDDAVESDKSECRKTIFVSKSDVVSTKKDSYDERQLEILSKYNTQTSDPSMIENTRLLTAENYSSSDNKYNSSNIPIINDSMMDSYNLESQKISSSKAVLIFHFLVKKLSVGDCDSHLGIVEKDARSSAKSLQNSLGYENDNSRFPVMETELKGLSLDMLDLLISGDMVDAEITNGEKHIKVHRAIVSARSSGLKKLLVSCMNCNSVEINYRAFVDIPSDILEDVIIFLYVGVIHVKNAEMLHDLYKVAERYCISDLIDICSKHL